MYIIYIYNMHIFFCKPILKRLWRHCDAIGRVVAFQEALASQGASMASPFDLVEEV